MIYLFLGVVIIGTASAIEKLEGLAALGSAIICTVAVLCITYIAIKDQD